MGSTNLFPICEEVNSAKNAIAEGGQYLEAASEDKFVQRVYVEQPSGDAANACENWAATPDRSLSVIHDKAASLMIQPVVANGCASVVMQPSRASVVDSKNLQHFDDHTSRGGVPFGLKASDGIAVPGVSLWPRLPVTPVTVAADVHPCNGFAGNDDTRQKPTDAMIQAPLATSNGSSVTPLNLDRGCCLQQKYLQSNVTFLSRDQRNNRQRRLAAQEFIDVEGREQYRQLLQQIRNSPIGSRYAADVSWPSSYSPKPGLTSIRSTKMTRLSIVHRVDECSRAGKDTPAVYAPLDQLPVKSPAGSTNSFQDTSVCDISQKSSVYSPINNLEMSSRESRVEKCPRTPASTIGFDQINKTLECPFAAESWLQEMRDKFERSARERRRRIAEEGVTARLLEEKRAERDANLEKLIRDRLSIIEPAVIEEKVEDVVEELPELSEKAELMVTDALRYGNPGDVLCEGFRQQIRRRDMETLAHINWLNDEVINFYMNLIMDRSQHAGLPKIHAFNTFFYPKLMSAGHEGLKRWTRTVDLFNMDKILVPVHLGVHWCLAVVDFQSKKFAYYDSMGGSNAACLKALRKYLEAESRDKKGQAYDTSSWKEEHINELPQQMNGGDCGVFTCMFAEYISRNKNITFTQEDMPYFRRRMVYELLTKKLMV